MASRFHSPNLIPGDQVTYALANLQVAVRANPGFTVVSIRTNAGLSRVFHTALNFGASKTESNCGQVNRLGFFIPSL